jgi:hypothetical protein
MKKLIGVVALALLAIPALAQVTKVEQSGGPCFMWGGSSGSQGQFISCPNLVTTVTVTKTEVKEVKVPGPVVIKEVIKEVPAKKIRE